MLISVDSLLESNTEDVNFSTCAVSKESRIQNNPVFPYKSKKCERINGAFRFQNIKCVKELEVIRSE